MKTFKSKLAGLAVASALTAAGSANAAFLLDDWQIDFGNAALGITGGAPVGGSAGPYGIDYMGFNDSPISVTYHDGGVAGFGAGDTYTVLTKGVMASLGDTSGGVISQPLLNFDGFFGAFEGYEISYDASLTVAVVGGTAGAPIWMHVANPADYLDFYIDDLGTLGDKAVPGTGAGYTDGVKVLTFGSVSGDGGSANIAGTLDGSDDATFVLTDVWVAGVFKTLSGEELAPGLTIGLVDSNFDLDSNNNGLLDETRGGYGCTTGNQSLAFFCGVEDGTFRLATTVPAPATLGLLGAGLLGLASMGRRRKV